MQVHGNVAAWRALARFEHLVVTETADEVLLYDTEKHHIHHLNATTAAVWRHCDGTRSFGDLARLAGRELGAEVDEATVRLALTRLDGAGLLRDSLPADLRMSRMSRRGFIQRAGVAAAVAVPAIVSTTATASAQSPAVCGERCGAFLNVFSGDFSVEYPCGVQGSDCLRCAGELAYGKACGGAGWVCYIGSCASNQNLRVANTATGGIPGKEQLQAYGEEVYADELNESTERPAEEQTEAVAATSTEEITEVEPVVPTQEVDGGTEVPPEESTESGTEEPQAGTSEEGEPSGTTDGDDQR